VTAGLHQVTPYEDPGLTRRQAGAKRVRALAVPPAWRDVWISRDPLGHIQAVGRDARGRLQYRYHERWRTARDGAKYDRLCDFCRALPALRRRVARDLRCHCVCRESVAATVVALLERGYLRVGNDEYLRQNGSYGATTLEDRHVTVKSGAIDLSYRGKGGLRRRIHVEDPAIARAVRRARAMPGPRLFQYQDGDRRRALTSKDVNQYLRETIGEQFSAKDFRTWAATAWCALLLAAEEPPASPTAAKRTIAAAIREVAERLGHTPAVCRGSYIHPLVIEAFTAGELRRVKTPGRDQRAAERCLLALLSSRRGRSRRRRSRSATRARAARR
jgi:DNA topoisomerase I